MRLQPSAGEAERHAKKQKESPISGRRPGTVDKPGDIKSTTHGLSTAKSKRLKLLSPGVPVHPASATGFDGTQVLGSIEEISLVHRKGAALLLLLCIYRTFNGITGTSAAPGFGAVGRVGWDVFGGHKNGHGQASAGSPLAQKGICGALLATASGSTAPFGRTVRGWAAGFGPEALEKRYPMNNLGDISGITGHLSTAKDALQVLSPSPRQRDRGSAHMVHGNASALIRQGKNQLSTKNSRAYYYDYVLIKTLRRRQ